MTDKYASELEVGKEDTPQDDFEPKEWQRFYMGYRWAHTI